MNINYQKLFNHINNNRSRYNAEVSFGTLSHYFDAVRSRSQMFPDLRGDFFPYADIFSEGRPAYWSGYFTTRPFYKALARQVETRLRGAEILFTVASNRRPAPGQFVDYGKLVKARRWLALFQHHDAITGTSKAAVETEGRSSAVILADGSWK